MDLEFPEDADYDTLGGMIIDMLGQTVHTYFILKNPPLYFDEFSFNFNIPQIGILVNRNGQLLSTVCPVFLRTGLCLGW